MRVQRLEQPHIYLLLLFLHSLSRIKKETNSEKNDKSNLKKSGFLYSLDKLSAWLKLLSQACIESWVKIRTLFDGPCRANIYSRTTLPLRFIKAGPLVSVQSLTVAKISFSVIGGMP